MSVMFYNPSTSGGGNSNILPTFQLFQNWMKVTITSGSYKVYSTTAIFEFQ